jgi:hypothetical protein
MLTLTDGTFFPLVANVVPWGRASGHVGLAPEALQECECSCRGFFTSFYQCAGHLFQPASVMFQPASVARRMKDTSCVRCTLGGVAVRQAPEPRPI